MTGFPEDLEQLLEAERDIDAPLPAQREQLFARLQPLLVVPAALAAGASAATTSATATQVTGNAAGSLLKAKLGAVAVSAALLGGVVGATGHAYFAAPAALPVAPQVAPASPTVATPANTPEPAPSTELAPPTVTSATPSTPSAPEPNAVRAQRPAGSLRAERLLLETASAALMRGDPESAMIALRQHAQRFPSGALAEEREALLARARAATRKP